MNAVERAAPLAAIGLALGIAGACGSSPPGMTMDSDAALFYDCTMEARAVPYMPGLERMSTSAAFDAKLTMTAPGPDLVKGSNTWTIQMADGTGAPVDGLVMKATPRMPDHNHGTSVVPVVTPDGSGIYTVGPLYLYMSGYWEVTLDITPPSGPADKVMFPVCIRG